MLAIPLVLFATTYSSARADGIRLLGLFIWIEILWVSFWVAKLMAAAIPYLFSGLVGLLTTGVRKYALVLRAIEIPISFFIWTIMALSTLPAAHIFDEQYYSEFYPRADQPNIYWLHIIEKICRASIGSSALWLLQKLSKSRTASLDKISLEECPLLFTPIQDNFADRRSDAAD